MLSSQAAEAFERTGFDNHHCRHDVSVHRYTGLKMLLRVFARALTTKGTESSIEEAS
jgi:hypothetical protein